MCSDDNISSSYSSYCLTVIGVILSSRLFREVENIARNENRLGARWTREKCVLNTLASR